MTPATPSPRARPRRLAIVLTESPGADVRGAWARRLVLAASRSHVRLAPVLFYGDAVQILLGGDARRRWEGLHDATGVELTVCPAATERRGIDPRVLSSDALFQPMGLPAWLDRALAADRVVRL